MRTDILAKVISRRQKSPLVWEELMLKVSKEGTSLKPFFSVELEKKSPDDNKQIKHNFPTEGQFA